MPNAPDPKEPQFHTLSLNLKHLRQMKKLPLTFVQSTVTGIEEVFTPAFQFFALSSSNGRLAFTSDKVFWLPDTPMAILNQGWVADIEEIATCKKTGILGFQIILTDGKKLKFANVNEKMREGITRAIESRKVK